MGKEINAILGAQTIHIWTFVALLHLATTFTCQFYKDNWLAIGEIFLL